MLAGNAEVPKWRSTGTLTTSVAHGYGHGTDMAHDTCTAHARRMPTNEGHAHSTQHMDDALTQTGHVQHGCAACGTVGHYRDVCTSRQEQVAAMRHARNARRSSTARSQRAAHGRCTDTGRCSTGARLVALSATTTMCAQADKNKSLLCGMPSMPASHPPRDRPWYQK